MVFETVFAGDVIVGVGVAAFVIAVAMVDGVAAAGTAAFEIAVSAVAGAIAGDVATAGGGVSWS